mmetsp:Transcript_26329/g.44973  ORF Transcript_26329/g.44973 Transcript_26329/m.44973 type:complete len:84 (-) Transcript_26329:31-282(-)
MPLSDEQRKQFDEFYMPASPIKCPKCNGENCARLAMGKPTPQMMEYAKEHPDRVKLGGCVPIQDDNGKLVNTQCNECGAKFHE